VESDVYGRNAFSNKYVSALISGRLGRYAGRRKEVISNEDERGGQDKEYLNREGL
jgi:hypothetical protein